MVESGLFGLFVTAIMCDQLQAIFGDETAVEQAKQQGPFRYLTFGFHSFILYRQKEIYLIVFCSQFVIRPRKPRLALLTEVCGRGSPVFWVFPCQSPPKDLDFISGYDV